VGVALTQEPNDSAQLLPAVDRVEQRLKKKPQQMVADSGYTTGENIEKMAGREIDFLGTMRQENTPRGANLPSPFPPSAFLYQPEKNHCVCPEGQVLHPAGRRKVGVGMIYHLYEARIEDCRTCPRKPECCPDNEKHGRSVAQLEESPVVLTRLRAGLRLVSDHSRSSRMNSNTLVIEKQGYREVGHYHRPMRRNCRIDQRKHQSAERHSTSGNAKIHGHSGRNCDPYSECHHDPSMSMVFKLKNCVRRIGQHEVCTVEDVREPDDHIIRLNPAC